MYLILFFFQWPGYRQWSRQIPTKDFRSPPQPITLAKLAKNVAKCVQRFMLDRKNLPMEEESDHRWKIGDGPDDIKLEDLILVSIHHVSLGSWQPHLRLVRPLRQQRHGHSLSIPQMPPTPMTASNTSPSTIPFSQLSWRNLQAPWQPLFYLFYFDIFPSYLIYSIVSIFFFFRRPTIVRIPNFVAIVNAVF